MYRLLPLSCSFKGADQRVEGNDLRSEKNINTKHPPPPALGMENTTTPRPWMGVVFLWDTSGCYSAPSDIRPAHAPRHVSKQLQGLLPQAGLASADARVERDHLGERLQGKQDKSISLRFVSFRDGTIKNHELIDHI